VIFQSDQPLVAEDTNGATDILVMTLETRLIERLSARPDGRQLPDASWLEALSPNGEQVVFLTDRIDPGQGYAFPQPLICELATKRVSLLLETVARRSGH
jgi:hypothetical protein